MSPQEFDQSARSVAAFLDNGPAEPAQEDWWDLGEIPLADLLALDEEYYQEEQCHIATIRKALEIGLTHPEGPLPMHTDEWELSKWSQWLHYLKAILCYAAGWHRAPDNCRFEEIPIALTRHNGTYAGWEAEWAAVGKGLFRNWFVRYVHDSDWYM